jgi:5'(3')-deoxyribonucleotidase
MKINEIDCWPDYKKVGTQKGTGKNKGKRVNKCVREDLFGQDKEVDNSNPEVYIDMDGVLADFFTEWAKLVGVSNWRQIRKIEPALEKIRQTENFWVNLPMLPEAKTLINFIKDNIGSYSICSSPLANDPNSEPQKREWIKNNLSFFPPKNVYITDNKPQFAKGKDGTANILIDDFGQQIKKWTAAGGQGIKYESFSSVQQAIGKVDKPDENM